MLERVTGTKEVSLQQNEYNQGNCSKYDLNCDTKDHNDVFRYPTLWVTSCIQLENVGILYGGGELNEMCQLMVHAG